jgi:hypothetical protein
MGVHANIIHTLLVCHALAFSDSWISSSVLPLVSGTSIATNNTVTRLAAENKKKVPTHRNQNKREHKY